MLAQPEHFCSEAVNPNLRAPATPSNLSIYSSSDSCSSRQSWSTVVWSAQHELSSRYIVMDCLPHRKAGLFPIPPPA